MNTDNISRAFVGSGEATRMYKGDILVWERDAPVEKLWDVSINFGQSGDTANIPGWNNLKPSSIASGGSFTDLVDANSVQRLSMTVTAGLADEIAPLPDQFSVLPYTPELYARGWAFFGEGSMTFTFSGLNDSYFYKVVLFCASPTVGGIYTPQYEINGVSKPMLQGYDMDSNIDYNSTYAGFNNIQPNSGIITVKASIPSNIAVSFGCRVIAYEKPLVLESEYTIVPVPDTDPSNPPCAYYHAFRPGTETETLPLIISLPMGFTEGDGSLGEMDKIVGGSIMKAVTTKTFNPSEDVHVISPQFYVNDDNAHLIDDLITHIKSEYNIDSDRVYIMGVSAGGENALYYAGYFGSGEPLNKIAAMMIANTPLTPGYVSFEDIASSKIPIWFFSNTGDNVSWIQDIVDGIKAEDPSYPLKMSVFTGGNHWTPIHFVYGLRSDNPPNHPGYDNYVNGEIYKWLLNHTSADEPEEEDVMYRLTIDVDGLTEGYNIIRNGESMPNGVIMLPKDTVINSLSLSAPGYSFTPSNTTVVMDEDKTITFVATQD